MGLFSSSRSNTTQNYEASPITVDEGIGIRSDRSTINIMDGGIVSRALDSIDRTNAAAGVGWQSLLDAGESLIGQTQKHVADAYAQAKTNTAGTLDNRTLIALAAVAVAGLYFLKRSR